MSSLATKYILTNLKEQKHLNWETSFKYLSSFFLSFFFYMNYHIECLPTEFRWRLIRNADVIAIAKFGCFLVASYATL